MAVNRKMTVFTKLGANSTSALAVWSSFGMYFIPMWFRA